MMLVKKKLSVFLYMLSIFSITIFLIRSQNIEYDYVNFKIFADDEVFQGSSKAVEKSTEAHLVKVSETVPQSTTTKGLENLTPDTDSEKYDVDDHQHIQKYLANVNVTYMVNAPKESMTLKCGKFPSVHSLQYNNMYWQRVYTSGGTFYLYAAYWDNRAESVAAPLIPGGLFNLTTEFVSKEKTVGPSVRLIAMINKLNPTVKTYCQLWFEYELVTAPVLEYKYIGFKQKGGHQSTALRPYLITCRIPKKYEKMVPSAVSLVEEECNNASNMLRVVYNRLKDKKKKGFAVCVKGLSFLDDISVKLAEWFELLSILGADKVFVYNLEVHPNVSKVLDYYEKRGIVDVKPLSLAGDQPNSPYLQTFYLKKNKEIKRRNELIPYNDCLYRNMYRYEYISLLDTDEVIMPVKHNSYADMMKNILSSAPKDKSSFIFRNVYFMDEMLQKKKPDLHPDIPRFLHMLQHVYRSRDHTKVGYFVKSFHNTEKVKTLHNHFPLSCVPGRCHWMHVSPSLGQMQHYRETCSHVLKNSCDSLYKKFVVRDTTIWRWKDQLISGTVTALREMGFLQK